VKLIMRALRAALDKAEAVAAAKSHAGGMHASPSAPMLLVKARPGSAASLSEARRPGSAATLSEASSQAPSAGGWPSLEARSRDDSAAVGRWVSKRLSQLQAEEEAERGAPRMHGTTPADAPIDLASWSVDDVSEWLYTVAGFDMEQIESLRAQGISGLELTTLDDVDLRVLGISSLPERKRLLRLLQELRSRAIRSPVGGTLTQQKLARTLETKRRRLSVLGECNAKVLATTPAIPLRTRRLLIGLWQQLEATGEEALAQIEQDDVTRRRREEELAEKARRTCRKTLEAQMRACADAEDRLHEAKVQLKLEKEKLSIIREAMHDESGLKDGKDAPETSAERAFANELLILLAPADFSVHEISTTSMGQSFGAVSADLEKLVKDAEDAGEMRNLMLDEAELVSKDFELEEKKLHSRERKLALLANARERSAQSAYQKAEAAAWARAWKTKSVMPSAPTPAPAAKPKISKRMSMP